jgi:hypothetical protein
MPQKTQPKRKVRPRQHQWQPGIEKRLRPRPRHIDPTTGCERLKDKIALVTGGDSGIGRAVAVAFAKEGADVAIAFLDEHEDAADTKRLVETEGRRCITIAGDVDDERFCGPAGAPT